MSTLLFVWLIGNVQVIRTRKHALSWIIVLNLKIDHCSGLSCKESIINVVLVNDIYWCCRYFRIVIH